jgi:DNA-binding winged helix-turn-helix (wHTH) protein
MAPESNLCYEFGEFVLIPNDKLLIQLKKPVPLVGRDFEILCYLVMHPNSLVRTAELVEAIWGPGTSLKEGNITNHIAKIRKSIGCDPRNPRFIKTVHGKEGYRFIASVEQRNFDSKYVLGKSNSDEDRPALKTISHLFVPVYLGSNFFGRFDGKTKVNSWLQYKEFPIAAGRLCVPESGFGVWHIAEVNQFSNLTEFAVWRKETYHEILTGTHALNAGIKGLLSIPSKEPHFHSVLGSPGYVFSAILASSLGTKRQETTTRMLQVLSCPSALESEKRGKDLNRLELQFLNHGIPNRDLEEFGLPGIDIGFASWDGLSYFRQSREGPGLEASLVEFEIAVQALWWQSKCFGEINLSEDGEGAKMVRKLLPKLKRQFSKIRSISETDSPSQRTMIEAVLKTSRIQKVFEGVVELYRELGS